MATTPATKTEDKVMEYVPHGAEDKIRLTIAIVKSLVAVKTKTGKTCSDQDAIKFMMMCQARRLNPFEGDAFLVGYDSKDGPTFSLITAHQAFLKRAELHPEYDGMQSGIIIQEENGKLVDLDGDFHLETQKLVGGWATVFFKGRSHPMHKRVRLKRFQKSWGIWQEDPAGMICKCAEADALRSSFPTMLGGLYLKEEMERHQGSKVSAPIFAQPVQELPEQKPNDVLKVLHDLCAKHKVTEEQIITCMREIGLAEPDDNTFEDVAMDDDNALPMVIEQFEDFVRRLKDTKPPETEVLL